MRENIGSLSVRIIICAALFTTTGCYTSTIYGRTDTLTATQRLASPLIVGSLARDPDIITEDYEPFFAAVRRGMNSELPRAGLGDIIEERDAATVQLGSRAFLVRYRARDFRDRVDANGGKMGALIACSILFVPCFFVGLPPTSYETVDMSWEMRLYDVTNIEPTRRRAPDADEMTIAYDTSSQIPIARGSYDIKIEAALGSMNSQEATDFARELASEMARRLINASAPDVYRATARALASPPASPPASTTPAARMPSTPGAPPTPEAAIRDPALASAPTTAEASATPAP